MPLRGSPAKELPDNEESPDHGESPDRLTPRQKNATTARIKKKNGFRISFSS